LSPLFCLLNFYTLNYLQQVELDLFLIVLSVKSRNFIPEFYIGLSAVIIKFFFKSLNILNH